MNARVSVPVSFVIETAHLQLYRLDTPENHVSPVTTLTTPRFKPVLRIPFRNMVHQPPGPRGQFALITQLLEDVFFDELECLLLNFGLAVFHHRHHILQPNTKFGRQRGREGVVCYGRILSGINICG